MQKKTIFIILIVLVFAASILSLYSSFAYNEENKDLGESSADYNLIFSLHDEAGKQVSVARKNHVYVDINVTNTYTHRVKYGTYYYSKDKLPSGIVVTGTNSSDKLEDIIDPGEKRTISLKITNDSEYNVDLLVGTLVGFENGNISDLVTDGIHLIK